jgi:Tfp pilus assembly protein PilF
MHVNVTRSIAGWSLGLLVLAAGCNTMSHSTAKVQAHERWNQVRGQIKLQLAEQQYESGMVEDAAVTLREAINLDPTQPAAYALLTEAYLELGKTASAEQALTLADRAGLSSAALTYLTGVIHEQRGRLGDAVEAYGDARELDPRNVDYLVAQAECLVSLGKPDAAIALLNENADRIDNDGTLSALVGHIAVMLDKSDLATERFGDALAADTGSKLVAEELGRLLVRTGRCEEALALLNPLVDGKGQKSAGGTILRAIATCQLALGHPAKARTTLVEYAQSSPDDAPAQLILAKAALACDDMMTALRAVDLVRQRQPNEPELWLVRAAVNFKRGKLIAAASDLYDVLQNDPNDVDAHCLLAEVMRARDQADAARTHFEQALRLDPDSIWATQGLKALTHRDAAPMPVDPGAEQKLTSAPDRSATGG